MTCPALRLSQASALNFQTTPSSPLPSTSMTPALLHPANPPLPESPKRNFLTLGEGSPTVSLVLDLVHDPIKYLLIFSDEKFIIV